MVLSWKERALIEDSASLRERIEALERRVSELSHARVRVRRDHRQTLGKMREIFGHASDSEPHDN